MMHYKCRAETCQEIFAIERIHDTGSGRTSASFCPFCGAVGSLVQLSAQSALLTGPRTNPPPIEPRPGHAHLYNK